MRPRLAVTGIGALSPVGLSGLVTLHSIRSGVSRLALQPFPDRVREWIAGSSIPKWVPYIGEERLSRLAIEAMSGALERAGIPTDDLEASGTTAVVLGCPEEGRPGYRFPPSGHMGLESIRGEALESVSAVEVVPAGSCSAQVGLMRAAELLARDGSVRRCVVGAVDSQLQLRTIRWHESNFRLKCSYVTDGLMPGEAACFLVVEPEELARARGAPIIARIVAVNAVREEATILSDQPNTAMALTAAVRATIAEAGIQPGDVGMVWNDLNGESYRAREWALTEVRLGFQTSSELLHPADCYGDVGIATDASLLGLAALCHGTGWSDGKPVLVFSGSEGGWRAATVLAPPEGPGSFLQVSKRLPRVLSATFRVPPPLDGEDDFRKSEDPPRAYFEWQLREEHRDELAALHYQRKAILRDETIPWPRLREPEQRMLNHLDAAVASGPMSMAVVAQGVRGDEEGLCFAGSFLLGTLPSHDNLAIIQAACEGAEAPRLAGLAAGLMHAPASESLEGLIASLISRPEPPVQAMAIHVAAKRRIDVGPRIARFEEAADPDVARAVAEAAWRLRVPEVTPLLQRFLSHDRIDVRRAAVLALLCLVPSRTAAFARARLDANGEFGGALAICLGVAGQLPDSHLLMNRIERTPTDTSAVSALGILGAPESVPHLIRLLESEDEGVKIAAGEALDLFSGLHARERVMSAPPPEAEDEATSGGDREVERVNTSVEHWSKWWYAQRSRLDTSARWRRGEFFSLGSCVDELGDPRSTFAARTRAHLELAARTAVNIPFEPDWFVGRQEESINAWRSWWERSRTGG